MATVSGIRSHCLIHKLIPRERKRVDTLIHSVWNQLSAIKIETNASRLQYKIRVLAHILATDMYQCLSPLGCLSVLPTIQYVCATARICQGIRTIETAGPENAHRLADEAYEMLCDLFQRGEKVMDDGEWATTWLNLTRLYGKVAFYYGDLAGVRNFLLCEMLQLSYLPPGHPHHS